MDLRAMVVDIRMVVLWSWIVFVVGVMVLNWRVLMLDGRVVHVVVLRLVDDVMCNVMMLG